MHYDWNPPAEDLTALKIWFDCWGALVAAVDPVPARALFADDVAAFGTRMDVVTGLRQLEDNQWRGVWPTIKDFRFLTEAMKAGVSPDRLMAVGLCTWRSTGLDEAGAPFTRPGRASVVFARTAIADDWKGIHTHFSLSPGTPQRSYGNRPARS